MYESVATLRKVTYTQDAALNQVAVYEDRQVFVKPRSVYSNDFYQAAQSGLKPSVVLVLFAGDYDGDGWTDLLVRQPDGAMGYFSKVDLDKFVPFGYKKDSSWTVIP